MFGHIVRNTAGKPFADTASLILEVWRSPRAVTRIGWDGRARDKAETVSMPRVRELCYEGSLVGSTTGNGVLMDDRMESKYFG